MIAYQSLVAAHVAIGVLALGAFWSAAFARKGSPLHRRTGQVFLLAMLGIVATGAPMALYRYQQGHPVTAAFLGYLVIITATGVWSAWRAIRDKHDVARYTGRLYQVLAWLNLLAGAGVFALGVKVGSPLLMGFSGIGVFVGQDMLRKARHRQRLGAKPRWWLIEHYTAMLGNGVATHIAFLGIGLPRLLPNVDGAVLHYLAWFGPVAVAIVAKIVLDRRWKPQRPAPTLAAASNVGSRLNRAAD